MTIRPIAVVLACSFTVVSEAAPLDDVDFTTEVRPLLETHCFHCHGPDKQKGRLRLDLKSVVFEGDAPGWVIQPGDPDASEIIARITLPADDPDVMPADDDPLPKESVEIIRRWIAEGAEWPDAPPPAAAAAPGPSMVDYDAQIRPILEARCYDCHGEERQKGGLRLDRREDVFTGAEADWVIQPGASETSELIARISLPADDPDIMPAKGDPLSAEEIDLVRAWIAEGAYWPSEDAARAAEDDLDRDVRVEPLTEAQRADETLAIAAVRDRGGLALPVALDTEAKEVSFALLGAGVDDDDLELLTGLEPSLVWLNLARTGVTDAGLESLEPFTELRRLHLEQTKVTDAGLAHLAPFEGLEYLNLFGTAVTDRGLEHLVTLDGLRRVYLWQSNVSAEGVERLAAALPRARIHWVRPEPIPPPPPEEPEPAEPMDDDGA